MTDVPSKNVGMRLWKSTAETTAVPKNALLSNVDKPTSNDKEGHFYFRWVNYSAIVEQFPRLPYFRQFSLS